MMTHQCYPNYLKAETARSQIQEQPSNLETLSQSRIKKKIRGMTH